jgi:hypothetical protein
MSGVEVLGLVLGILPLLVSAIEHYEDVLRPIRRYRQFTSKAQRFCDELEAERTVFQAECQLLLGVVVDLDVAKEMLSNPNHPSWRDEVVCTRFSCQLGTLGATCLSIVSKIEMKVNEIGDAFKDFSADISQPLDVRLLHRATPGSKSMISSTNHCCVEEKPNQYSRVATHKEEEAEICILRG